MIHISIFALVLMLSISQMCRRSTAMRGPGNTCITTSSNHPSYPYILLYRGTDLGKDEIFSDLKKNIFFQ